LGREGKVRPEEGVGWGVGVVAEVVADVAVVVWGMWGRGEQARMGNEAVGMLVKYSVPSAELRGHRRG
jgi:hypothetical protein